MSIPDGETAAELSNGYRAAWCVSDDGKSWPWLVADLCDECQAASKAAHAAYRVPAHENTGRLPREVRDALGLVPHCGAPTRYGTPCRQVVAEQGKLCGQHARKAGA